MRNLYQWIHQNYYLVLMIMSNLYQKREKQVPRIIYSKKNYLNFVKNKPKLNGKNGRIN
jgi:hypothetical protein